MECHQYERYSLYQKAPRFFRACAKGCSGVLYKGKNKLETVREQEGGRGYACGFEGLIGFVQNLLDN